MDKKTQFPNLLESYKLGDLTLPNRLVMASLTRCRCDVKTNIPTDDHVKYYSQRASAGLILTECSPISNNSQSFLGAGGIYKKEHVAGWKRVTDAVHAKGGRIFIQIWHGGRAAHSDLTGEQPIAPSALPIRELQRNGKPHVIPKEMTLDDIKLTIEQFRQGAINAKEAGFDGIELHGANGYLVDQFLRDGSNQRKDQYGGPIENRVRFCLEVIDVLIEVFGAGRVGIKISPAGRFQDMYDSDPVALYGHLLTELDKRGIAYVQVREPESVMAPDSHYEPGIKQLPEATKTLAPYFKNGTMMINESLTPETASKAIQDGYAQLAVFGKLFIANPDFVERVRNGWSFNQWDVKTFYTGGATGYTDYPEYNEAKAANFD